MAKPISEQIGAVVRELRQEAGWSLAELGKRTGLSKTFLWEIEQGRKEPCAGTIARLCRVLKTRPDILFGHKE